MRFKEFIAERERFHGRHYRRGLVRPVKLDTDDTIEDGLTPDELAKLELLHLNAGDVELGNGEEEKD